MGGHGFPPKPAALRQRRNKSSGGARLETDEQPRRRPPDLGPHPLGTAQHWHHRTREWWRKIWASPMAAEVLRADEDGLFMLATLVDQFWHEPSKELAAEIRLQRQAFGLSPVDRQRLRWEVARGDKAERARSMPPRLDGPRDPRSVLHVDRE